MKTSDSYVIDRVKLEEENTRRGNSTGKQCRKR